MADDQIAAIVVAAGRGTRAGGDEPKQWRLLAGKSVLSLSVGAFARFGRIVVVLHPDDMARGLAAFAGSVTLVAGGESRAESVRAALEVLEGSGVTKVLIHDGARPFVPDAVIDRVIEALRDSDAAAPGLAVTDALWLGEGGKVRERRSRDALWRAQTPQGFRLGPILAAHRAHGGGSADDVEVALAAGMSVAIVEGDEANYKITYPADFERAIRTLENSVDVRAGNGFDVHAFAEGNHVVLCGVRIPHSHGLLGHSDADVGMHALTDALYGALAEGDIGRHFPPSDAQWKGAASEIFLAHAGGLVRDRGYRIGNGDVTLICEMPKIGPHAARMQAELSRILLLDPGRISVKATTSERLGFTGRSEGIAAIATVTLVKP